MFQVMESDQNYSENILATVSQPIVVLTGNQAACDTVAVPEDETRATVARASIQARRRMCSWRPALVFIASQVAPRSMYPGMSARPTVRENGVSQPHQPPE